MMVASTRAREFLSSGQAGGMWQGVFVVPKSHVSAMVCALDRELDAYVPLECRTWGVHGRRYGYVVVAAKLEEDEEDEDGDSEALSPSSISEGIEGLRKARRVVRRDYFWLCDFFDFFPIRKFVLHDPGRAKILFGIRLVNQLLQLQKKEPNKAKS